MMADSAHMTWAAERGAYSVYTFLHEVKVWQMQRKAQASKPLSPSNVLHHIMQRLLSSPIWPAFESAYMNYKFLADGKESTAQNRDEFFDLSKFAAWLHEEWGQPTAAERQMFMYAEQGKPYPKGPPDWQNVRSPE